MDTPIVSRRHATRNLWTRRLLAPASVLLSLGLLLAILIYAQATHFRQKHGEYSLTGKAYNLSQTTERAGTGSRTAPVQGQDKGVLQQGVTVEQANAFLEVGTAANIPAFSSSSLTVKRGQVVSLTFRNNSEPQYHYQDSWVLVKPNKAGEAAVAASEAGPLENFIPRGSDVLANTRMLKPGESQTIVFRAPSEPGDYPFMSTFPGHSQAMKGVLHVE